MNQAELSGLISEHFAELSPQLRIAARHVLDHPEDVALMSMRQLAGQAGVQPSTMVRLAREFDFDTFRAFQKPFQSPGRFRPGDYLEKAKGLQSRGHDNRAESILFDEILEADLANLRRTFGETGADSLIRSAKALSAARHVYVLGLRSCHPIAYAFHYACRMFKDNTTLLGASGSEVGDELRALQKGDVLLAASFEPYTRETVRAVHYARDHGGKVLALTDSRVSPLATVANETLLMSIDSPSFFPSVSAGIALAQCMVAIMALEGDADALAAIGESEKQLASFDAYWPLPRRQAARGAGR